MATITRRTRPPTPMDLAQMMRAFPDLQQAGYAPTGLVGGSLMVQSPFMQVLNPTGLDGNPLEALFAGGPAVSVLAQQAQQQLMAQQEMMERNLIEAQRVHKAAEYARRVGAPSAPYLTTGGEARQQDPSRPMAPGFNPYAQAFASPGAREGAGTNPGDRPLPIGGNPNSSVGGRRGFGRGLSSRRRALLKGGAGDSAYPGFGGRQR